MFRRKKVKNTSKSQRKQRYVQGKVKVKFALQTTIMTQSGRNRISLLFFKPGIRKGVDGYGHTHRPRYSGNDRGPAVQEVWSVIYSHSLVLVRSTHTV